MNKKFYIITGFAFVLCVIGGFVIAKKILNSTTPETEIPTNPIDSDQPVMAEILSGDDELSADEELSVVDEQKQELSSKTPTSKLKETPIAETKASKPQITNAELTAIINNLNNKNYPRDVKLKYNNIDKESGEQSPTSIALIRQNIQLEIWKSVTVTDVTFDKNNKVTSITMTINR